MLITDKEILKKYGTSKRLWQGIPSIEVTKNGRIFITFYSGGTKEEIGNYVLLVQSDDGIHFSEPIAVAYEEGHRCFDSCLWIDPLGRMWLTWAIYPNNGVFATICENPDADELVWGEEFFIGNNVMMNKPTVLRNGEWMFPLAVWVEAWASDVTGDGSGIVEKGSYAYMTSDNGNTFQKLGYADVKERSFDEHQILEMKDGTLRMFVRTKYGIGAADSYDGGKTWNKDFDTGYGGPSSRFHITRLRSGRILLVNHYQFEGRNNLTALLSEDDGKTFPYTLLLDERKDVSYPDAKEADDGYIYITYDRERGAFKSNLKEVTDSAREILMAKITEEDILQGKIVSEESSLKQVVSKLVGYSGDIKNPFKDNAVIESVEKNKIIAIVRGVEKEKLIPLAEAMYEGGIRLLELTYSADGKVSDEDTAENIRMLCEHFGDRMYIGAGTVIKPEQVELTKKAGGRFIISPDVYEAVIKKTCELGMVSMPGALTTTEIQAAHRAGADFVKMFPITNMGTEYVKAVKAPLSHIKLLAVGGVDQNNMKDYLKAGVNGFGVGSNIINKKMLAEEDYAGITALAKEYVAAVCS